MDERNRICRCRDCGFVFDNPRPTMAAIAALYSRPGQYSDWIEKRSARDVLWLRRLEVLRKHVAGSRLLDIGAGIGQFAYHARRCFEVTATEVSEQAVRLALELYGIDVIKGEVETLDLPGEYDVVTLYHVLEHVPNPTATIAHCRELLRTGGILAVAVPNELGNIRSRVKRLLARAGVRRYRARGFGLPVITLDGSMAEIHVSHFTEAVLYRLLERNGFRVTRLSLDRYYVPPDSGRLRLIADGEYYAALVVKNLTGVNLYETILAFAAAV